MQRYLSEVAIGRRNNITFLRLIAALAVIYGHSHAVTTNPQAVEFVSKITGYAHAGGVAVDVFFIMSGFLVTASVMRSGIRRYAISRFTRIFPALWVNLIVVALVIGPIVTMLSVGAYLSDPQTWRYVWKLGTAWSTEWLLPGVFADNRDQVVNGSIWSVVVEVRMYLLLAAIYLLRVYRYPALFNTLFFALLTLTFTKTIAIPGLPAGSTDLHVAMFFLIGSFLYVNQQRIPVSPFYLLFALVFAGMTLGTPQFALAYTLLLTTFFVYAAFGTQCHWINNYDYSYGIYLYGWPVQQLVAMHWPAEGAVFNAIVSMLIATLLGGLSWHLVESPIIKRKFFFEAKHVQSQPT